MDGWKSRTCPLEASRVKACQANVRRKLSKQKNESQGAVGKGVDGGGHWRPAGQVLTVPMKVQLGSKVRPEEGRETIGSGEDCQTGSSVPLPEGPQLSSGPVDCDREGILTQYHQISPFFKNSMES